LFGEIHAVARCGGLAGKRTVPPMSTIRSRFPGHFRQPPKHERSAGHDPALPPEECSLQPADQPGVGGDDSALPELFEPAEEIVHCVHHSLEHELLVRLESEESLAHDLRHGTVRQTILVEGFPHGPDQTPASSLAHPHATVLRRRAQVHQRPAWAKNSVCFVEGMDHALGRHSSESPGEDHAIELARAVGQALRAAHAESNAAGVLGRESGARLTKLLGVGIDRVNALRSERCQPQCQATVSTTDLEQALAAPAAGSAQRLRLASSGIDYDRHGR
jgi:hypothetical protein